jgi:ketosteroid isomerase-like protein
MKALLLILLASAVTATGHQQRVPSDTEVVSQIVALENLWTRAAAAKDLKVLEIILDASFICVESGGRFLTKAEVMKNVAPRHGRLSDPMVVRIFGDTAVVTGTYQVEGAARGKPFTRRDRFVDTWRRKNGVWVSIASLATPIGS